MKKIGAYVGAAAIFGGAVVIGLTSVVGIGAIAAGIGFLSLSQLMASDEREHKKIAGEPLQDMLKDREKRSKLEVAKNTNGTEKLLYTIEHIIGMQDRPRSSDLKERVYGVAEYLCGMQETADPDTLEKKIEKETVLASALERKARMFFSMITAESFAIGAGLALGIVSGGFLALTFVGVPLAYGITCEALGKRHRRIANEMEAKAKVENK